MTIRPTFSNSGHSSHVLKVERPYYEQEQFNSELNYCQLDDSRRKTSICGRIRNVKPKNIFLSVFPLFSWLSQYNVKSDLVGDLVSGCTVAIMHIPQGMGYAMLAGIPAITGIYTAFFPVLVYFVFGTSRHNSMGTFAVVSIMVGKTVHNFNRDIGKNHAETYNAMENHADVDTQIWRIDDAPIYTPMQIVTALCLIVGAIQVIMYVLRLGIISSLLSETLVSGFTTGAGIHVLTSQVKDLLGIELETKTEYFKVIMDFYQIFTKLNVINWAAFIISAVSIVILCLNNEWLKPRLSRMCFLPVPIELIVVVTGTLLSRIINLADNYHIKTIGDIPTGFPAFGVPNLGLLRSLIADGFIIAMVSYTISVSMALIFAQKLNYEIDFNQELLAMGAGNIVGSFFSCMPFAASLSRSAIQQSTGGKTQIASLISCGILTVILLWIGPFFEELPRCVLASVVVVALKGMLMQTKEFFVFWKLSRLDAAVWMATFMSVVIFSIDIGLLVGIVLSLACIFIRGMKPYTCLLGHIPKTDLYLDINRYRAAEELNSIKIYHYCGSLNFASRTSFKTELCSKVGIDLATEIRNKSLSVLQRYETIHLKCLIIDFSALSYIDPSGVTALKLLINDFNKLSISVFIAGSSCPAYEMMKKCDLKEQRDGLFKFFPTIHDAVHHAMETMAPISVITDTA